MEPAPPATLLTGGALIGLFELLPAADAGRCACVCRSWRAALASPAAEPLWRRHCAEKWALDAPAARPGRAPAAAAAAGGGPPPAWREAYAAWEGELGRYGAAGARAARAWRAVEAWAAARLPPLAASLRRGATEAELDAAEAAAYGRGGLRMPPGLRVLYRLHDGQHLQFDRAFDSAARAAVETELTPDPSLFHGLFGGYSFYDKLVCVRMLPLHRAVEWARRFDLGNADFPFAASYDFAKCAFVDLEGAVKVPSKVGPGAVLCGDVLEWFEAFAARLARGVFCAAPLLPPRLDLGMDSTGVCLFPAAPPARSEAVTCGVRVRAAPVLVPELSVFPAEDYVPRYHFAYSVSFELLGPEEQAASWDAAAAGPFRPLASVQLRRRRWAIRGADGEVRDTVEGDGVVGEFPVLAAGEGRPFVYQSCTQQGEVEGSMEGAFEFAEAGPGGRRFWARCVPFRLAVERPFF